MKEVPKGGFFGKLYHAIQWATSFHVELYAAHACFFIVLSLFPTLVLLLGLLRYTGLDAESLLNLLESFVPEALFPLVNSAVKAIYLHTTGTVISISAIGALWSAGRGIYGLVIGLNAIHGVKESRGYFLTRIVSMGYMFAFLALVILTLILNVYSTPIFQLFSSRIALVRFFDEVVGIRFLLLLGLQTVFFTLIFKFLPNKKIPFPNAIPGAVLSVVGWFIFSKLYSVYVTYFSTYAGIYDSLYSVALGMLWLYFCICIIFYGGVLNRYLMDKKL